MQEISYSDVKLGKDSEEMSTALGWMNVEWYTFCVRGKSYLRFTQLYLRISLSFCLFFLISSFKVFTTFFTFFIPSFIRLCSSKTFCVNNLNLSPLTDSYFSNKLLTQLIFEMTYSIFLFQNTIFGMTNSKVLSSEMWLLKEMLSLSLCTYTKFQGGISRRRS